MFSFVDLYCLINCPHYQSYHSAIPVRRGGGIMNSTIVFRIFRLIARFSKYDFWIPGKISDGCRWTIFSTTKKIMTKIWRKQSFFSVFFSRCFLKFFDFRCFLKFFDFWFFGKFWKSDFFQHFFDFRKKSQFFSDVFFVMKKICFQNIFHLHLSEIFSGIQKSYLENHAMSVKIRKIKKSFFFATFRGFWISYSFGCTVLRNAYINK